MGIKILFIILFALGTTAAGSWLIGRFIDSAPKSVGLTWVGVLLLVGGWAGCDLHPIVMEAVGR